MSEVLFVSAALRTARRTVEQHKGGNLRSYELATPDHFPTCPTCGELGGVGAIRCECGGWFVKPSATGLCTGP